MHHIFYRYILTTTRDGVPPFNFWSSCTATSSRIRSKAIHYWIFIDTEISDTSLMVCIRVNKIMTSLKDAWKKGQYNQMVIKENKKIDFGNLILNNSSNINVCPLEGLWFIGPCIIENTKIHFLFVISTFTHATLEIANLWWSSSHFTLIHGSKYELRSDTFT